MLELRFRVKLYSRSLLSLFVVCRTRANRQRSTFQNRSANDPRRTPRKSSASALPTAHERPEGYASALRAPTDSPATAQGLPHKHPRAIRERSAFRTRSASAPQAPASTASTLRAPRKLSANAPQATLERRANSSRTPHKRKHLASAAQALHEFPAPPAAHECPARAPRAPCDRPPIALRAPKDHPTITREQSVNAQRSELVPRTPCKRLRLRRAPCERLASACECSSNAA